MDKLHQDWDAIEAAKKSVDGIDSLKKKSQVDALFLEY